VLHSTLSIQQKLQELEIRLSKMDSLLIAFSGGIDSSFLLAVAASVLREKTIALMTVSNSTPPEDEQHALSLAERLNVEFLRIQHDELAIPQYAANPKNRCYFCKDSLYAICKREAERLKFQFIADGINIDDLGDYRPGIQAAAEYNIIHPLVEVQFTKSDIRQGSKLLGLSIWNKPASPCLSSRIPYGSTITKTMLSQIAKGENVLRTLGFKEVRLRHHGKMARIEVAREESELLSVPAIARMIGKNIKAIGFDFVGLDAQGYKRGIFNENS